MTVSPIEIFNKRYSELKSQTSKIEREYANANQNNYKRLYPNLSQQEIDDKIDIDRLGVLERLFGLLPTLQADTKLTAHGMLKDVRHASSKILNLSDNTIKDIALSESGLLAGSGDNTIDINPFISEIQIPIKVGTKKQYITIPDDDNPGSMLTSEDYLEVDDYNYETVTVIEDKGSFENTINNIVNQAVTKATQQVDSQLENFNYLVEESKNNGGAGGNSESQRELIRFEAAKLLRDLSSGKDITVVDGTEAVSLNWLNTNKRLTAKDHYSELMMELETALLEGNGIKLIDEEKIVKTRGVAPDGNVIIKEIVQKTPVYKLDPLKATSFGRTLFNNVQVETPDKDGNTTLSTEPIFNIWSKKLRQGLIDNIIEFTSSTDTYNLSRDNDSKMYEHFLKALDLANYETPKITGGAGKNEDWMPVVPENIFATPVKPKGLFDEVGDILNNNNKISDNNLLQTQSNLLFSNFNTNQGLNNNNNNTYSNNIAGIGVNPQTIDISGTSNNQQQLQMQGQQQVGGILNQAGNTNMQGQQQASQNTQYSSADAEAVKNLNTLQSVLNDWKS